MPNNKPPLSVTGNAAMRWAIENNFNPSIAIDYERAGYSLDSEGMDDHVTRAMLVAYMTNGAKELIALAEELSSGALKVSAMTDKEFVDTLTPFDED